MMRKRRHLKFFSNPSQCHLQKEQKVDTGYQYHCQFAVALRIIRPTFLNAPTRFLRIGVRGLFASGILDIRQFTVFCMHKLNCTC